MEEKRFECENIFYKELEEDIVKWKQSSDQIIYDHVLCTYVSTLDYIGLLVKATRMRYIKPGRREKVSSAQG